MARMNTGRIVAGGLAAGLVMNVMDFLSNGLLLGAKWEAQMAMLNPGLKAKAGVMGMAGWIVLDFVFGLALVWIYAAIRPRFGPGPRTGAIASLLLWIIATGAFSSYWFTAMFTWRLVAASAASALVSVMLAGYVGGMLYKEADA